MKSNIAYCGLDCAKCPAYIATLENDAEKKAQLAREWSTDKFPLKPEDIYCEGCSGGSEKVISFCAGCDIRTCALENRVESCVHCNSYPCSKLEKHFERSPDSRENLEKQRSS